MFSSPAAILGFITSILVDPLVWALIVLWILYAKSGKRGLKIAAIVCSVIAGLYHLVIYPLTIL